MQQASSPQPQQLQRVLAMRKPNHAKEPPMANLLLTVLPFALTFTIAAWTPLNTRKTHVAARQETCPGNAMYC
jgi:hypothetical protein